MDLVDFILSLLIGLAVFSLVIVWLIEQVKGQKVKPRPAPPPSAQGTSSEEATSMESWPEAAEASIHSSASATGVTAPVAAERGRELRRQLGLDRRSTLQRSVVLITALGPCRANEGRGGAKLG
jgi:hypothetical protein